MENERGDIRSQSIKYKKLQTLMYHINKETLIKEHQKQITNKASGIDKMTKEKYEENLYNNIDKLIQSMKIFKYKPQAVRRTYIPKANGKLRPLGIPAYEDKLVQGVMANILNEIYEPRFLNCSYGFRPNRNCHQAITSIKKLIMTKPVNYILDANIFEIVPKDVYTSDDLNWSNSKSRVSREHDNESLRNVELKTTKVDNWDSYDTVLIGYPIWWGVAAWPVNTFVKANDFNSKTVIPFCTSASSDIGNSGKLLESDAGSGNWKSGQRFSSNASNDDIKEFTDSIK